MWHNSSGLSALIWLTPLPTSSQSGKNKQNTWQTHIPCLLITVAYHSWVTSRKERKCCFPEAFLSLNTILHEEKAVRAGLPSASFPWAAPHNKQERGESPTSSWALALSHQHTGWASSLSNSHNGTAHKNASNHTFCHFWISLNLVTVTEHHMAERSPKRGDQPMTSTVL